MKVDVYKVSGRKYVMVRAGSGPTSMPLPFPVTQPPIKTIDLNDAGRPVAVSPKEAIKDIEEQGFHVAEVKFYE